MSETVVTAEFARGFQAAYEIVKHMDEQERTRPFTSILGAMFASPLEALEAIGRTMRVGEQQP